MRGCSSTACLLHALGLTGQLHTRLTTCAILQGILGWPPVSPMSCTPKRRSSPCQALPPRPAMIHTAGCQPTACLVARLARSTTPGTELTVTCSTQCCWATWSSLEALGSVHSGKAIGGAPGGGACGNWAAC